LTVVLVTVIKGVYDFVKEHNTRMIDRYVEVVGRISALLIGTIPVEMFFEGLGKWLQEILPRV
jgi:multiple antibiotic resistance protein